MAGNANLVTPRVTAMQDASGAQPSPDWMVLYRDRHRAERAARWKFAAKTNFAWLVCPFLGCLCSLKSEFAVKVRRETMTMTIYYYCQLY